jgi:predicted ATP-grasp superfamily ATP-dependent carboligase
METSLDAKASRRPMRPAAASHAMRVFIPAGDSPFSVAVAQCLKRAMPGLHITAGYRDRNPIGRWSRFIDRMLPLGQGDPESALMEAVRRGGFDAVLPVAGPEIELVAAVADRLRPYAVVALHPSVEAIRLCNDKWAFAQALQRWGVPTPRTVLLESAASLDAFADDEPLLVKPRAGSGGAGIMRYAHRRALTKDVAVRLEAGPNWIVQEYVDGTDIDRSILADAGRVFAGAVQEPLQPTDDFKPSMALRFREDHGVDTVTNRVAEAMGYSGVVHFDLRRRRTGGLPLVIEANPRYWASMLGALLAGVNFPELHLRRSLGEACVGPAVRPTEVAIGWRAAWRSVRRARGPGAGGPASTMPFVLRDPLPRLMTRFYASTALGAGRA